ncbi:MAG: hypothetical protein QOH24_2271 [Verrucomicrobiota bacterium]
MSRIAKAEAELSLSDGTSSALIMFSTGLSAPNTSSGQVLDQTFLDGSNLSLGLGNELTSQGPFGPGFFANNFSRNIAFGQNTSLTQELVVTQGPNWLISIDSTLRITNVVSAPEGGSAIILLGLALVAMEILRRRSRPQIS